MAIRGAEDEATAAGNQQLGNGGLSVTATSLRLVAFCHSKVHQSESLPLFCPPRDRSNWSCLWLPLDSEPLVLFPDPAVTKRISRVGLLGAFPFCLRVPGSLEILLFFFSVAGGRVTLRIRCTVACSGLGKSIEVGQSVARRLAAGRNGDLRKIEYKD